MKLSIEEEKKINVIILQSSEKRDEEQFNLVLKEPSSQNTNMITDSESITQNTYKSKTVWKNNNTNLFTDRITPAMTKRVSTFSFCMSINSPKYASSLK